MRKALASTLNFYQRYLTLLGFGSCRYYPTCSEYARWQVQTNPSLFKALFSSALRVLRCNQLFEGGIDYPKISCHHLSAAPGDGRADRTIRFWYVPEEGGCRVIKNIFSKGPSC